MIRNQSQQIVPLQSGKTGLCSTRPEEHNPVRFSTALQKRQGQQFEAVWVFPFFTGRDCRTSLWPGAWSKWPRVLKWYDAVVGQTAWHLQEENLRLAGAGFGSSFIFAWRLCLSGYIDTLHRLTPFNTPLEKTSRKQIPSGWHIHILFYAVNAGRILCCTPVFSSCCFAHVTRVTSSTNARAFLSAE